MFPVTLVVNLWAGPGAGKSTNAALVFGKLKVLGVEAELVHEYAKDLTWEQRMGILADRQSYVLAKQQHHIERVMGQVEVIVTDSPLPFSILYKGTDWTDGLESHIMETFNRWENFNVFLERDVEHHPYKESGRRQNLEEAEELDRQIAQLLGEKEIPFVPCPILEGEATADVIVALTIQRLNAIRRDEGLMPLGT